MQLELNLGPLGIKARVVLGIDYFSGLFRNVAGINGGRWKTRWRSYPELHKTLWKWRVRLEMFYGCNKSSRNGDEEG
ncbi:hypothetical protein CsSME_00025278 [Camellia sinensis var. sinensis]